MRDFLGNEFEVGDQVVFMQLSYRNLVKGKVIKETSQMCTIQHEKLNVGGTTTRQFHNQVIKVVLE